VPTLCSNHCLVALLPCWQPRPLWCRHASFAASVCGSAGQHTSKLGCCRCKGLTKLPEALSNLSSLQTLNMSECVKLALRPRLMCQQAASSLCKPSATITVLLRFCRVGNRDPCGFSMLHLLPVCVDWLTNTHQSLAAAGARASQNCPRPSATSAACRSWT
jgi:hypothetical protein